MSGSTSRGGQMTPSDFDNFSLRFPPPWPCVSAFERFVGSPSVEHSCWPGGVAGVSRTGGSGGRFCAPAIAVTKIETDSAAIIPVNEVEFFMPCSDICVRNNDLQQKPFLQLTT
jgi:hypothetical protein